MPFRRQAPRPQAAAAAGASGWFVHEARPGNSRKHCASGNDFKQLQGTWQATTPLQQRPPLVQTSASSSPDFGVESLQFRARVFDAKLPIDSPLFRVCFRGPRCNLFL
jgi:hypothetical protein